MVAAPSCTHMNLEAPKVAVLTVGHPSCLVADTENMQSVLHLPQTNHVVEHVKVSLVAAVAVGLPPTTEEIRPPLQKQAMVPSSR